MSSQLQVILQDNLLRPRWCDRLPDRWIWMAEDHGSMVPVQVSIAVNNYKVHGGQPH